MQTIKSKAEFFRLAKEQTVTRTQVGGMTLDEWDNWVVEARKQLIEQGAAPEYIIETDTKLEIKGSSQFWNKPKVRRVSTGKLVIRSKDYYYESGNLRDDVSDDAPAQSFGNLSDFKLVDNKLVNTMYNGAELHYTLNP